ncbi:MAG: hypothetical protein SGARI_004986, partial [Bacillariaceae sp.]
FLNNASHWTLGEELKSDMVETTPELLEEWREACETLGATPPDMEEAETAVCGHKQMLLQVRAGGVSFLGVDIEWTGLIGAKVVHQKPSKNAIGNGDDEAPGLPGLEFVLIKDDTTASGKNKPLLWLFNRITKAKTYAKRETRFLSRIGFEETTKKHYKTGEDMPRLRFKCEGAMEMKFPTPRAAARMIGTNLPKMEAQVNNLITAEIEKEMKTAIMAWEHDYQLWLNQQARQNARRRIKNY